MKLLLKKIFEVNSFTKPSAVSKRAVPPKALPNRSGLPIPSDGNVLEKGHSHRRVKHRETADEAQGYAAKHACQASDLPDEFCAASSSEPSDTRIAADIGAYRRRIPSENATVAKLSHGRKCVRDTRPSSRQAVPSRGALAHPLGVFFCDKTILSLLHITIEKASYHNYTFLRRPF